MDGYGYGMVWYRGCSKCWYECYGRVVYYAVGGMVLRSTTATAPSLSAGFFFVWCALCCRGAVNSPASHLQHASRAFSSPWSGMAGTYVVRGGGDYGDDGSTDYTLHCWVCWSFSIEKSVHHHGMTRYYDAVLLKCILRQKVWRV